MYNIQHFDIEIIQNLELIWTNLLVEKFIKHFNFNIFNIGNLLIENLLL